MAPPGLTWHAHTPPLPQILDRVLARIGGRTWWATLGSRMHAQRAFCQGAALDGPAMLRPLKDPQNYAACLRLHSQIAR